MIIGQSKFSASDCLKKLEDGQEEIERTGYRQPCNHMPASLMNEHSKKREAVAITMQQDASSGLKRKVVRNGLSLSAFYQEYFLRSTQYLLNPTGPSRRKVTLTTVGERKNAICRGPTRTRLFVKEVKKGKLMTFQMSRGRSLQDTRLPKHAHKIAIHFFKQKNEKLLSLNWIRCQSSQYKSK